MLSLKPLILVLMFACSSTSPLTSNVTLLEDQEPELLFEVKRNLAFLQPFIGVLKSAPTGDYIMLFCWDTSALTRVTSVLAGVAGLGGTASPVWALVVFCYCTSVLVTACRRWLSSRADLRLCVLEERSWAVDWVTIDFLVDSLRLLLLFAMLQHQS